MGWTSRLLSGEGVFSKKNEEDQTNNKLVEKITNELMNTFKRKGIDISQIHIDLDSGSVNVSVCIAGKKI